MEESKKRRERLQAMRMEAAEAEASEISDSPTAPGYLSNPLIEPSVIPPVEGSSPAAPRFDFYTDPMAAFSGNKRRSNSMQTPQNYISPTTSSVSPITRFSSSFSGPRNTDVTPSPAHQYHGNYSPNTDVNPSPAHQYHGNYSPNSYTPNRRIYEASPSFGGSDSWRSPVGIASPFPGHQGTPPGVWNRSGGRAGYSVPFHPPRGGGFHSPGRGWGGSPSSSSGRGSSRQFSNSRSPGSGRGGGKGRGFHAVVSARERPDMFYNRTMLEDPWRLLTPVVRNSGLQMYTQNTPVVRNSGLPMTTQHTSDSLRSWLPKSVGLKKARVSEVANEFNSQSSLAECLAASFEEAVSDATSI